MRILKINLLQQLNNNYTRLYSSLGQSKYVEKVHLYNYWSRSCNDLEKNYSNGKAIVLLDKHPIIKKMKDKNITTPELVKFDYDNVKETFKEYGLDVGRENTVLLDVISPEKEGHDYKPLIGISMSLIKPDPDSGIDFLEARNSLANDLGGECFSLRMCILTINNEEDRNYLAKLQSTMKWHRTFRLCPYCGGVLKKKLSKASCTCTNCHKIFYPNISPVSMVIIRDPTNQYCLLVRHLNSVKGVFTTVAGFVNPGETIKECAKREVAEELGIECHNLKLIDDCQPWPIPDNSLLIPFSATVDKNVKLKLETNEIESARWFSKKEVLEAVRRTENDPFIKNLPSLISNDKKKNDIKNHFYYVPPPGALAFNLIKMWAENLI